ncbi:MAG: ABC transporter ATP-binding protein, partial [Mesorhizobium sp.]
LMARPRILLLDEPSLGLSPLLVSELQGIILDVREKFRAAVLLVEQNAGLALSVAEQGYLMNSGRIVASGSIDQLKQSSVMQELYLGKRAQAKGAL